MDARAGPCPGIGPDPNEARSQGGDRFMRRHLARPFGLVLGLLALVAPTRRAEADPLRYTATILDRLPGYEPGWIPRAPGPQHIQMAGQALNNQGGVVGLAPNSSAGPVTFLYEGTTAPP